MSLSGKITASRVGDIFTPSLDRLHTSIHTILYYIRLLLRVFIVFQPRFMGIQLTKSEKLAIFLIFSLFFY